MKKSLPKPTDRKCPKCERVNEWHRGGVEIVDESAKPQYPRMLLVCACGYGTWLAHDEIQPRWLQDGCRRNPRRP